jgi:hypothetical protein
VIKRDYASERFINRWFNNAMMDELVREVVKEAFTPVPLEET